MPPFQPVPAAVPLRAGQPLPVNSTGGVLFHAGEIFSVVELQAMRMDGLVSRVLGESYLRADHRPDPVLRALAAINCVPRALHTRVALGRQSAAWVYGCAPPPKLVSLVTDHRRRTTALPPFSDAAMHQVTLGPYDVNLVGGVPVTTPLRTALDIAVHGQDPWAGEALKRISADAALDCSLALVITALQSTRRVPGKGRALHRLTESMAAP